MKYWEECIREAFQESKIEASEDQINNVIAWVEGAHENYSMATGHNCIPHPALSEADNWKKKYEREKDKKICNVCSGEGRLTTYGGTFTSNSACYKCSGEGYIYQ